MLRAVQQHWPQLPSSSSSPSSLSPSSSSLSSCCCTGACADWKQDRLLSSSFFSLASVSSSLEAMEALAGRLPASSPATTFRACLRPRSTATIQASLTQSPVLWAIRTCTFYALLQLGIAGGTVGAAEVWSRDGKHAEGASKWLQGLFGNNGVGTKQLKRVRNKWQTTTKGTLKRKYRVPTKAEGRRLLHAISLLLSDDDTFRDAMSHKGCQIRRENAHAESVCCNNVRALYDELPTLHLVIEITAFPAGFITEADYKKAEKIEQLLRTGNSI